MTELVQLRFHLRRRASKSAEEGFHVDSGLFERAADAIEALSKDLAAAKDEASRLRELLGEYRDANSARASEIANRR